MDRRSAWHNFRGAALAVMRARARAQHPSRRIVDALMRDWFGDRPFDWLDVGVVGMVDYERLRPRMSFRFIGADLSEAVLDDAKAYLRQLDDRLVRWDVEDAPPQDLRDAFDLVTVRHVLNHCHYYEAPLDHLAATLRPGGYLIIVLHLHLIEGHDELRTVEWDVPGEVLGNRYEREAFLRSFVARFDPVVWIRADDGVKPNDVIVGRRPRDLRRRTPDSPRMHRLWTAPGKRQQVARLLSRIALARKTGIVVR